MFERSRIGSSIDYFLRSARVKSGVQRTRVEIWLDGHSQPYADEMRREKLAADQAAVRLITDVVLTMTVDDVLELKKISPEIVEGLKALLLASDALLKSKPEQYAHCFRVPPEGTIYAIVMS